MFRLPGLRYHLTIGVVFLASFILLLFNNVSAQEFSLDKIPPQYQAFLSSGFDLESLTLDQCKAIEAELSKRGGQPPPEAEEILNKCSSMKELTVEQSDEIEPETEGKKETIAEQDIVPIAKIGVQPLER